MCQFHVIYHLACHPQKLADKNFQLFKSNPQHPSLHFERKKPDLWSVRVGGGHRALARQLDDNLIWFWIGPHDEYERLLGIL